MTLQIEKNSNQDKMIQSLFTYICMSENFTGYNFDNSKKSFVEYIDYHLPKGIKVGCGGSHIWISNQQNERLAIIYK